MIKVATVDTYVTGSGSKAILVIYDIFGFNYKQVLQVCDRLAAAGYTVACADLFDGKPWSMADFPPSDGSKFMEWIQSAGSYERIAPLLTQLREWLGKEKGCTTFGTVGFCWGSCISLACAGEDAYCASACCHPAFFGKETALAEAATSPVCILPAKGDPMEDAQAVLQGKPFADKCLFRRFDDQEHGFMAARGEWEKPEVAKAAGEGIKLLVQFFNGAMA